MGTLGVVFEEGGIRSDSCSKVLTSVGSSGASFWGGNMGLDSNDDTKTGGGTRGFIESDGGYVGA